MSVLAQTLQPVVAIQIGQVAQMVERSPEKAGVGGSIPSLATITTADCRTSLPFLVLASPIANAPTSITNSFYVSGNKRRVLWQIAARKLSASTKIG